MTVAISSNFLYPIEGTALNEYNYNITINVNEPINISEQTYTKTQFYAT